MTNTKKFDLLIRGGTCLIPSPQDPDRLTRERTMIGIKNGKIAEISDSLVDSDADQVFDATSLYVLPGAIDSQVHFREPGLTHKEDLESGTRGAILGGISSVFEMPNTKPSTTTAEGFAEKLRLAENRCWSDYAFFIGATPDNVDTIAGLELHPNCCAVKIFMGSSTGTLLLEDDETLKKILLAGRRRVAVHSEDEPRLRDRRKLVEGTNDVKLHPFWRDDLTAITATQRLLRLAKETRRPVHVLHVTTGDEMELIKNAKDIATCEVTPQHLTLAGPEAYERLGTLAQMNPPIREERHREALWKAVNDGTVTVIGSDHAPHTLEEKAKPYPDSPSGMTGVQTILPIMLDHMNKGRLSLERLVELLCRGNARLYGARNKGEIREGFDADFSIVDLSRERVIENSWIASKSGWTPYDGMKTKGWAIATLVRGQIVMRDFEVQGSPTGKPLVFN